MISCDFAPNEAWDDAWLSFKLIFQPWRWINGKETENIKKLLLNKLNLSSKIYDLTSFLTGRAALYHLLKTLNLPENSEIIVQGFTCEAVVLPIIANSLRPIYADIEAVTFSIDPIELKKKIGPKTKAIILQHSFGITPKHREKIISLAKQHNLLLIEDIAHGFSNFKFQISNLKSVYLMSFGRSKALSSVFGGAIATNDKNLAKKLELAQKTLQKPSNLFIFQTLLYKPFAQLIKTTYDLLVGKIIHKILIFFEILLPEITKKEKNGDYDFFLDKAYPNALAILLSHQLKKFDQIQRKRAKICQIYQQQIFNSQFSIFNEFSNFKFQISNSSLSRYPMLVKNKSQLIDKAQKQNIFLGNWYGQPIAPTSLNLNKVQYKPGTCPVAEKLCQQIINLPTNISTNEAIRITKLWK